VLATLTVGHGALHLIPLGVVLSRTSGGQLTLPGLKMLTLPAPPLHLVHRRSLRLLEAHRARKLAVRGRCWGWQVRGGDGSGWLSEFGGGAALAIAVEVVVEALVPLRHPGELEEGGGGEAEEVGGGGDWKR